MRTNCSLIVSLALTSSACSFPEPPDVAGIRVSIFSGDGQQGVVGTTLQAPLIALVQDQDGQPIENLTVDFSVVAGNGMLSTTTDRTDALGHARTTLALDRKPGENAVEARVNASQASAVFTAEGVPGEPVELVRISPDTQSSITGMPWPPFIVAPRDQYGNAIPGIDVTFAATGGVTAPEPAVVATTDATGHAAAVLTPVTFGNIEIQASVTSSTSPPARFTGVARSFAAPVASSVTRSKAIASADFDGDGVDDVAIGRWGLGTLPKGLMIYRNTTPPGSTEPIFASPKTFISGVPVDLVAIADFNNDSKPDMAALGMDPVEGEYLLYVMINTSNTSGLSFAQDYYYYAWPELPYLAIADLDNDGDHDIIGTAYYAGLSIWMNTSTPGSTTPSFAWINGPSVAGGGITALAVTDLDGDGKPDLLAGTVNNQISIFQNTTTSGLPTFDNQIDFDIGGTASALSVADINGDSRSDLIFMRRGIASLSVMANTSSGASLAFAPQVDSPTADIFLDGSQLAPNPMAFGHVNGDQRLDIIVVNRHSATLSIFVNLTSGVAPSFAEKFDLPTGSSPIGVALANINKDARLDLLSVNNLGFSCLLAEQ